VLPERLPVTVDVSRTTGGGYALRLRAGRPRCRGRACAASSDAQPRLRVDAREVELPGGGEELDSPYVQGELLDLRSWVHDAVALAAPTRCCASRTARACARLRRALASAGPEHHHEREPDPRWAKLRELDLS
jgi:uncharacterized protein